MCGIRYELREKILSAVQTSFQRFSKNGLEHVYEQWRHFWLKCIKLGGEHIERTPVSNE